jgi:hypothetical protein
LASSSEQQVPAIVFMLQGVALRFCSKNDAPGVSCAHLFRLRAGLYFTLDGDRERSRNMIRAMAYNMSDANLCELGKGAGAGAGSRAPQEPPAADDDLSDTRLGGKLSAPTKRYSNPAECFS